MMRPTLSHPADPAGFSLWWHDVHEPVLADLIDHGLADGQALACQVRAEKKPEDHPARYNLRAFLGIATHHASEQKREELALAFDEARSRRALAIGLAYVEVRRDQNRVTLRTQAFGALRDNREIAGFRREAGLVSDLDVSLSGMMIDLNVNSFTSAQADLAGGLDRLAAVSGYSTAQLQELLADQEQLTDFPAGEAPTVDAALAHRADLLEMRQDLLAHQKGALSNIDAGLPDSPAAKASASNWRASHLRNTYRVALAKARADLAAAEGTLATATTHAETLRRLVVRAERNLFDARLNYRLGKGGMALLYVSEASALAARENLLQALATLDAAAIRLWTAQGRGWSMSDPPPVALMNGETVCD